MNPNSMKLVLCVNNSQVMSMSMFVKEGKENTSILAIYHGAFRDKLMYLKGLV